MTTHERQEAPRSFRLAARDRLAAPVVLVYWVALFGGLALYSVAHADQYNAVIPLWIGAITGTVAGHYLALRDLRTWIALLVMAGLFYWAALFTPYELDPTKVCMAYAPAALCAYWSLGERTALAAFWFPAVVWMLSILDRTRGATGLNAIDGAGAVLLGGLAVLFVVYLRVRESRRVGLWTSVGARPVAAAVPTTVLREPAGRQVARAGWSLFVSGIAFAITAFVAPQLFTVEKMATHQRRVSAYDETGGLPCCPALDHRTAEVERARVKEYLDLGRGRDDRAQVKPGVDCRVCTSYDDGPRDGVAGYYYYPGGDEYPGGYYSGEFGPGIRSGGYSTRGRGGHESVAPSPPSPSPSPSPSPGYGGSPAPMPEYVPPTPPTPQAVAPPRDPFAAPRPTEARILEAAPPPVATTEPVPMPNVRPQASQPHAPSGAAPQVATPPPPSNHVGGTILHWMVLLIGAALMFQVVALALRPLRRLVTLRHLRRPFWDETVDQRVSNAWQLALIGLRDAGWRSSTSEGPREFARRVSVEGVEQCAAILERARHGVGLDAQDLTEMNASAETAYRSARGRASTLGRAVGWVRWPLT